MKITVQGERKTTERIDVELDVFSAASQMTEAIRNLAGIPRFAYVEDGKIVTWDSGRGGSGITTTEIEKPSTEQLRIMRICDEFMGLARKYV